MMQSGRFQKKSGRGFVTIATGDAKYYRMALNLLKSYRKNSKDDVPFALLCDRDCPEARAFDTFVLMENVHSSYLDKLSLYQYTPYAQTIFIDADALILSDTRVLWQDYEPTEAFSCYGKTLPLDSKNGWFFYEDMGELKDSIHYIVSMHGGLYYLRESEGCRRVFEKALSLANEYGKYTFANFKKPADEPVLALSMALEGCKPHPKQERILFVPSFEGTLRVNRKGEVMQGFRKADAVVLHFANRNLNRFLYQYLIRTMEYAEKHNGRRLPLTSRLAIRSKYLKNDLTVLMKTVLKKILPKALIKKLRKNNA